MKKKIIFLTIFILLLAVGGVGIFYYTQTHRNPVVYANEAKYKTYTAPAPTDGTTPTDHDAYDNIAYVLWVLEHTEKWSSLTEGTAVSVGQTQTIYNHRRVNGDEQLVDTISGGLVSLGKQKYFLDNKVLIRDYISKNGDNITWKTEEPECITDAEYIKRYGWLPNQATAYIICKDTIVEISEVTALENGLYSITLLLNPDEEYAPFWYQREIGTNASSLSKPAFSSIQLEYIFNAKWQVQQVNTKEKYEVTPKVAPIKVTCETNIKETFDYEEYEFDSSAMDFFEQYKNMVPVGGTTSKPEENTPLTYITGSLLGGSNKEKTFDLSIKINNRVVEGKLLLDISDLNDVIVKVSLGDLQVVYQNKEVFVDYGTIKIKCNIDEFTTVLQPLLEEIVFDQTNPGNSLPSNGLDVNQILNDLNNATIIETEDIVDLEVSLNLLGFTLPLHFTIEKNNKEFELLSIESTLALGDVEANVFIEKNDDIEFIPVEGEYNDLKDLNFIIQDITSLLKNKKFSINFNLEYESYLMTGQVKIGLQENDPLQLDLFILHSKTGIEEEIQLIYDHTYFYVMYKNIRLKLSKEDLVSLIHQYGPELPELPSLEMNQIIDLLFELDFKTILKNIKITEDEILFDLDLSHILENELNLILSILDTEKGFSLQSNLYNITLDFDTTTDFTLALDKDSYVDAVGYIEIVEYVVKNLLDSSMRLVIDGNAMVSGKTISILGTIDLLKDDTSYRVEGNFTIRYDSYEVDIQLLCIDKDIYLTILGYTFKLNTDTLSATINTITQKLGVELPAIDFPEIKLEEILQVIHSIKLTEGSLEADLTSLVEFIGIVGLDFSLTGTNLNIKLSSALFDFGMTCTPIENRASTSPAKYFDETDLLYVMEYVEDILSVCQNQHAYFTLAVSNDVFSLSGNLYVDWKNSLSAQGHIILAYDQHTFEIDIIYLNETLYISYNTIQLKMNSSVISDLFGSALAMPDLNINGMLSKLPTLLKKVEVTEDGIDVGIDLSDFDEALTHLEIRLKKTSMGIDILADVMNLQVSLDTLRTEEIKVEDSTYATIDHYLDLIDYFMKVWNKESIGIELNGTIYTEQFPIEVDATIDMILNSKTNLYDVDMNIALDIQGIKLSIQIRFIEQKLYITLYENTIALEVSDLAELYQILCDKFNLSIDMSFSMENPFNLVVELINQMVVKDSYLELNLGNYISVLSKLVLGFMVQENKIDLNLKQENLFDFDIAIKESNKTEVTIPTATLGKEDLYQWIEDASYIYELVKGNAIRFDIENANISFTSKDKQESVSIQGGFDLLLKNKGIELSGKLSLEGMGVLLDAQIAFVEDRIYVTVSNQTICLKLSEIDSFIEEVTGLLAPIISFDLGILPELNTAFDFADLCLELHSNSFKLSLEELIGKACEILLQFELLEQGFGGEISGSFDHQVSLNLPFILSKSEVSEVVLPSKFLTKDDILEIITYVVDVYELSKEKEFNLSLNTTINTNGSVVASINGNLYLNLIDEQEFDARLQAVISEYQDDEVIGWHQIDVQIISLTTMNTLDSSVGQAMFFATYGNNPEDKNAVVKVKSSYTGIEDFISAIMNLMNIELPSLANTKEDTPKDLRSILENVEVQQGKLSFGLELNSFFDAMLDERQVTYLTLEKKNGSSLDSISASNLYVSYTNMRTYTKLENATISLLGGSVSMNLPTAEEREQYYDISNISCLFEALYHNALEKSFSIAGDIVLKVNLGIKITETIPVKIKVGVEEDHKPIVHLNIDLNNLKVGALLASKKTVDVYYYHDYVYIERTESNSVKRVKVHFNVFMNDIVYYLLDFGMGLSNMVLDAINKPTNGDGFVDASKCITSVNIQKDTFEFGLNMGELTDNFNLENLFISLGSSMVYQKNSDGTTSLVPMIHKINSFEFTMVKVISLSSSNLKLENIDESTSEVKPVDVSFIDVFAEDYNQTIDSDGNLLQSDVIYEKKNDLWVKSSAIEHKVTFDFATSATQKENQTASYLKGAEILIPQAEKLIKVTQTDGSIKYYEFKGWYLDASYLKEAQEEDWIMTDRNKTFYAKYLDVTATLTIHSPFSEDTILTSYLGESLDSYFDLFKLVEQDGKMYQFKGFIFQNEECDYVTSTIMELDTLWEEIEFYALYDQTEKRLSLEDNQAFLTDTYYIPLEIEFNGKIFTIYDAYQGSVLTPNYLVSTFHSLFNYHSEVNRLEIEIVSMINKEVYFSTILDESLGCMVYIPNELLEAKNISLEKISAYQVNAWIDRDNQYYSWYDLLTAKNKQFKDFYLSTKQNELNYELSDTAKITGYNFDSMVKTLITPRYVYEDGKAILVTKIGANAFYGADKKGTIFNESISYRHSLETIILHEGLVELEANAFKNCAKLLSVYLPSTLTTVAVDAFYIDIVSKSETNRDIARLIQFHILPVSSLNVGGWYAYRWNSTKYYYNSDKVPNSSTEETNSIVESVYFVLSK
ncbi:MAG: hypothetical protein K2N64_06755 [Anaeroplasmataceae bacterium]|nr:hypothetical protein [Anaeroplasmataceae bacterium]